MPRGRHRHSPPLHRLLPPSAIAGVSLVCALGPWVFTEPGVLRGLAAAAALTAVTGAVVMRRWDTQAGKQVADLTRARAGDEWRFEERVAELETDLDESRELRVKLEHRLRTKRAELQKLRNEHAGLLRRYATAETERASALEGRRLLEIEAAVPAPALPPGPVAEETESVESAESPETGVRKATVSGLFSPEGSQLFLRANAALARFDGDAPARKDSATGPRDGARQHDEDKAGARKPEAKATEAKATEAKATEAKATEAKAPEAKSAEAEGSGSKEPEAQEAEVKGKPEAADGHQRAVADTKGAESAESVKDARPAPPARQPGGHFTVPTAVAVVPASAPVRRPTAEGGFDFFGTKQSGANELEAAVQNEDLADVVGREALDLHKAEAESGFKPADEGSRAAGQVIDLTEHDETEQIDLERLRTAAS
ncbi:hypothetical protein [Streptomyces sp. NPDC057877]|uniref:hypothetical protein n=1 Tax=Streptomyces sp. NPDC057877 TaxID=3346269 RepID=UPI0036819E40